MIESVDVLIQALLSEQVQVNFLAKETSKSPLYGDIVLTQYLLIPFQRAALPLSCHMLPLISLM